MPGVFTVQKTAAAGMRLTVKGKNFTSQQALENYLAYRAATETLAAKQRWFRFTERRIKTDTLPVPKADPAGPRFSFRLAYFRPVWRYRLAGDPSWKSWTPFSGQGFPALDTRTVTDYELSADIILNRGPLDDVSPLSFDASALSDHLINQVEAPK
jgi:hypothetical protein